MNILEVFDYSWNPSTDNLKKQARICVGVNVKPILMDINTSTGVGPAISSLDSLGISHSKLNPSNYTSIILKRGKKLYELPVLGQIETKIHHARGRSFRCRTGLKLERDSKAFSLETHIIEKFPKECEYGILAGHDFLDKNGLSLDDKNAQIVNVKSFPAKTIIQYMHPTRKFYLGSHNSFWSRHFKPPENKVKIVPPKTCENCGANFRQIKKNEHFIGKYKKGEMIFLHGEIDHFPCTLGLTVRSYSNNHMIKAIYKKARSKMVLSVPECAVRRKEEDESSVIPEKYNNTKKISYPAIVTQVGAVKTEEEKLWRSQTSHETLRSGKASSCSRSPASPISSGSCRPSQKTVSTTGIDASTQTKSEPKKRNFSRIKSVFSECLYPFTEVENWVNHCPSECSDFSSENPSVVQKSNMKKAATQKSLSHITHINSPDSDADEFPDNYINIPEQHRMITFPARCFNLSQDDVLGNPRAKTDEIPDDVHEFLLATDDEYNRMFQNSGKKMDTPDEFKFNCASKIYNPDEDDYSSTPEAYKYNGSPDDNGYNRMVALPDRMFKFHNNAKQEDILGNAGGGEEPRQCVTKPFRPADDDDISGYS